MPWESCDPNFESLGVAVRLLHEIVTPVGEVEASEDRRKDDS